MKSTLRMVAAIVFFAAIVFWAASGANRGWTKTSVPQRVADPVTGIEGITYQKKFVPGVDFLAVITTASVAVAGASFLFRTKSGQTHQTNKTN